MTRPPEAGRFLKLLRLEFIMASVLGLFYTLLNVGVQQSPLQVEYTPL